MTVMVAPCLWYVHGMKLVMSYVKFPQAPSARAPFGECRYKIYGLREGRLSRKSRKNDKDNSDGYKQGVECRISGNHGNHGNDENQGNPGCKPRVPQRTGLEIPDKSSLFSLIFDIRLDFFVRWGREPPGPGNSFSDFFSTWHPKGPNDPCRRSKKLGSQRPSPNVKTLYHFELQI